MSQEHTPDKNTHWWRWQCPLAEYFSPHICSIIILVWFFVFVRHTHVTCADIACERVCVCVTLQVPMQPTGLSGRPVNPSFLLTAKKRYAWRRHKHKQTCMRHCGLSVFRHFSWSHQHRHEINTLDWLKMSCSPVTFKSRWKCESIAGLSHRDISAVASHQEKWPAYDRSTSWYYLCVRLWGLAIMKGPYAAISGVLSEPKRTNGQRSD